MSTVNWRIEELSEDRIRIKNDQDFYLIGAKNSFVLYKDEVQNSFYVRYKNRTILIYYPDVLLPVSSSLDDLVHNRLSFMFEEQTGSGGGGGATGTVTSVGLSLPMSLFSVSGSPVTTSGTLSGSLVQQSANKVFAGPTTGANSVPSFRNLVENDIPTLTGYIQNQNDSAQSASYWIDGSGIVGNLSVNQFINIGNGNIQNGYNYLDIEADNFAVYNETRNSSTVLDSIAGVGVANENTSKYSYLAHLYAATATKIYQNVGVLCSNSDVTIYANFDNDNPTHQRIYFAAGTTLYGYYSNTGNLILANSTNLLSNVQSDNTTDKLQVYGTMRANLGTSTSTDTIVARNVTTGQFTTATITATQLSSLNNGTNTGYIQNQNSTTQTADYSISGTGKMGKSIIGGGSIDNSITNLQINGASGVVKLKGSSDHALLDLDRFSTSKTSAIRYYTNNTGDWEIGTATSGTGSDFQFYSYGSTSVITTIIKSSGNWILGTSTSDAGYRLDIGGNGTSGALRVQGRSVLTVGTLADTQIGLSLTATLPSAGSFNKGIEFTTTTGTTGQNQYGFINYLNSGGNTNNTIFSAGYFETNALGAGVSILGSGVNTGNFGLGANSYGTNATGYNVGLSGKASNGLVNVGTIGISNSATSNKTNIGGLFTGYQADSLSGSTAQIGSLSILSSAASTPSYVRTIAGSAAMIADNGTTTSDIAQWRDNNVIVGRFVDGGRMIIGNGADSGTTSHLLQLRSTTQSVAQVISSSFSTGSAELYLDRGSSTGTSSSVRFSTTGTQDWQIGTGIAANDTDLHFYSHGTNANTGQIFKSTGNWNFGTSTTDSNYKVNISNEGTLGALLVQGKQTITAGTLTDQTFALGISATMSAGASTDNAAVNFSVISNTNASPQFGLRTSLSAGATAAQIYSASKFTTTVAGTGTSIFSINGAANYGVIGISAADTTGYNVGVLGQANDGAITVGTMGRAVQSGASKTNIGAIGAGLNGGVTSAQIGGLFYLGNTTPTYLTSITTASSAAGIFDNGTQTSDIQQWRDNGTIIGKFVDGGRLIIGTRSDDTSSILQVGSSALNLTFNISGGNNSVLAINSASQSSIIQITRNSSSFSSVIDYYTSGTIDWRIGTGLTGTGSDFHYYSYGTTSVIGTIFKATGNWNIGTSTTDSNYKLDITSTGTAGAFRVQGRSLMSAGTLTSGQNALALTTTLANNSTSQGVNYTITGSGTGNVFQQAFRLDFLSGFTGVGNTTAASINNANAGTGTSLSLGSILTTGIKGNIGTFTSSQSTTTGYNLGSVGFAGGGILNIAVFGISEDTKNSGANIGVFGNAINAGTSSAQIGGLFTLGSSTPTYLTSIVSASSAALIVDNSNTTSPILLAKDNGTTIFAINDGGYTSIGSGVTDGTNQLLVHGSTKINYSLADATKAFTVYGAATEQAYIKANGIAKFNLNTVQNTDTIVTRSASTGELSNTDITYAQLFSNSVETYHDKGTATLTNGSVTITYNDPALTANTQIFLTYKTISGSPGFLATTIVPGTSFTIASTNILDNSQVHWIMYI